MAARPWPQLHVQDMDVCNCVCVARMNCRMSWLQSISSQRAVYHQHCHSGDAPSISGKRHQVRLSSSEMLHTKHSGQPMRRLSSSPGTSGEIIFKRGAPHQAELSRSCSFPPNLTKLSSDNGAEPGRLFRLWAGLGTEPAPECHHVLRENPDCAID